jgi:hypothetical protein
MTKFFKINRLVLPVLLTTAILAGCKKSWFDINTNPNQAVESNLDPATVLPGAMAVTGTSVNTGFTFLGRWLGFWATAAGVSPDAEEQSYNISNGYSSATFTGIMDNNYDFQFVQNISQKTNQTFYFGIAQIMKAHNFARLVDAYNNVPYSQALQGEAFVTPVYDDAKTIYEDLIKQIDLGMASIKSADLAANPKIATADIMFKGDKVKWAKFGNTLKLRLLMHQANRADRQDYIRTEMTKITAEGSGFLATGETAAVNPGYNSSQPNPYYSSWGFTLTGQDPTQVRANSYGLNLFKTNTADTVATKDPRIAFVYRPVAQALPARAPEPELTLPPYNYRGNIYGLSIDNAVYKNQTAAFLSKVGGSSSPGAATTASSGIIKGYDQGAWIITSIESLFLQVEAIQRGYLPGSAKDTYALALRESFRWLNVNGSTAAADAAFNTWYNKQVTSAFGMVSYDAAPDKLRLIALQKYLALSGIDEFEIWNEYRRNGAFPNVPLSAYPSRSSNSLPIRLLYPQVELNYNEQNVPAEGRKTGDQFTAKIWWMP